MSFQCQFCGQTYPSRRGLSYHQNKYGCIQRHRPLRATRQNSVLVIEPPPPPADISEEFPAADEENEDQNDGVADQEAISFHVEDDDGDDDDGDDVDGDDGLTVPITCPPKVNDRIHIQYHICPCPLPQPPAPPGRDEIPVIPPPRVVPRSGTGDADMIVAEDLPGTRTDETTDTSLNVQMDEVPPVVIGRDSVLRVPKGRELPVAPYDQSMARLYKICDDAGAPKFLCDQVLKALQEEMLSNQFDPLSSLMTTRKTFFPRVQRLLEIQPPEEIHLTLETGQEVSVFRFHFLPRLQQHLLSQSFFDLGNLSLPDAQDVWSSVPSGGFDNPSANLDYSSSTTSLWYKDTCKLYREKLVTGQYLLHPLTLYIDKTGADGIMKNTLEPLVCTSNIFTGKARQDCKNWFVLGFIPNLEISSSAGRRSNSTTKKKRSIQVRDYHKCLSVLLQPIVDLQKNNSIMSFRRGADVAKFKIICPVATVLGDNLSNDKLCGKISNKTKTSVRMSRCCLTCYDNCDTLPHKCNLVDNKIIQRLSMDALGCCHGYNSELGPNATVSDIGDPLSPNLKKWFEHLASLTEEEKQHSIELRKLREELADAVLKNVYGSHVIDNAFGDVDFGANSDIHQATMADLMHSVEEGIFKHVTASVIEALPDSAKGRVDVLVASWFTNKGSNRSGERPNYPRVSFTRGFCSPSLLSADERVGQLFILAMLLHTKQGREAMGVRFDPKFDEIKNSRKRTTQPENQPKSKKRKKKIVQKLKTSEQLELLDALDMAYLTTNRLPPKHKLILQSILDRTLTSPKLNLTENGLKLPETIMAFRSTAGSTRTNMSNPASVSENPATDECLENQHVIQLPRARNQLSLRSGIAETSRLVEQLLAFHAFAKYGGSLLSSREAIHQYHCSFHSMMVALKQAIQRPEIQMATKYKNSWSAVIS